jgi:hypothetical protein
VKRLYLFAKQISIVLLYQSRVLLPSCCRVVAHSVVTFAEYGYAVDMSFLERPNEFFGIELRSNVRNIWARMEVEMYLSLPELKGRIIHISNKVLAGADNNVAKCAMTFVNNHCNRAGKVGTLKFILQEGVSDPSDNLIA